MLPDMDDSELPWIVVAKCQARGLVGKVGDKDKESNCVSVKQEFALHSNIVCRFGMRRSKNPINFNKFWPIK